ncbi:TIGR03749 family integrating conjugative element protein [Rouxiella badensis]|uniref:TIGR03749 family integrating conjugative element protein n=1 Tax=Rouxiella badensis TaxID=1646377 RepID=UPI001D146E44|nr:TIGR03749 family integrating conjugative element protein [Rouxiella badensis]
MLVACATQADELMKWERIPLQIPLAKGIERAIFVDKNVRVGFPPSLNGKLRIQSSGGVVYLKAEEEFSQTRIQLQDKESGQIILLDVRAKIDGPAEPVRIIYQGEVTAQTEDTAISQAGANTHNSNQKRQSVKYNAPLPVVLTRYAAQMIYAPRRTLESLHGIRPINPHLPKEVSSLYPSEPVKTTTLAAWGIGQLSVTSFKITNTLGRKIILDPRKLQGKFISATFQHSYLGPVATPEDTTTLYVVTAGRPDSAFVSATKAVSKEKLKGNSDAD